MKTAIQKAFAPFKVVLPRFIWEPVRALGTALMTPIVFSQRSGHFVSSFKQRAVSRKGKPIPWYTYPCIHLLLARDFSGKRVLEFGGGQSTSWWASRAESVVTVEGDAQWYEQLVGVMPANVNLHLVQSGERKDYLSRVTTILKSMFDPIFDVVVIDGDFREDLVDLALKVLKENGALICDDAESYGFFAATQNRGLQRVDFFGHAPGVVLPRCTSIFYKTGCFLFESKYPIPDLATELL